MTNLNLNKKYNILFLMNGAKPPRGGEFLTFSLIRHLRRDIYNPILIYAVASNLVKEIKKETGIDTIQIPLSNKITNIYPREIKLHNPFFILTFIWRLFMSGSVFKLNKLIIKNDIHLVYCADNLSKLVGGITGKIAKIKVVAHCHDDFKEDVLGKTMRMFYLLLLDRILTVSEKVRKFFTINRRISQKAITVYNGVNADVFNSDNVNDDMKVELGLKEDTVVIGSISVLEKDKGQKYLIEAIAILKSEGLDNIVCVICGTGPEETNLKKLVYARGLSDEVIFLGFRNDIPGLLKVLEMIVITSLTIESFSMVAVEAMSMKVPVIATMVGGLHEVIDDRETGILVPPGNEVELYKALRYLIEQPIVRKQMGLNGRKRVLQNFTIEQNVRKTEEVFLQLIEH